MIKQMQAMFNFFPRDVFDVDLDLLSQSNLFKSLKKRLIRQYNFSARDADEISEFLRPMLEINPSKRATAAQMLRHKWLEDVVQVDLYNLVLRYFVDGNKYRSLNRNFHSFQEAAPHKAR